MTANLFTYLQDTQRLLADARQGIMNPADLTIYINRARRILAGEAECVRVYANLVLTPGQRQYGFSAVNVAAVNPAVEAPFNARFLWYVVGEGQKALRPRGWPWFAQYKLNNPVPNTGVPQVWSQYGQGDSGSIFFDPVPDDAYTIILDTVCVPIELVDSTTAEAIPYPWTDAVPFFAAYTALLTAQARKEDAAMMLQQYEEYKNRARKISNPSILPGLYEQATPIVSTANQLGVQPGGAGG